MALKYHPDGTVTADTPAEMVEYAKLMQGSRAIAPTPPTNGKTLKNTGKPAFSTEAAQQIVAQFSDWALPSAIKLLETIAAVPAPGATREQLMKALGLDDFKSFGGRIAAINKLIERAGYPVGHVYASYRTTDNKFWKGRVKLKDAVSTLKSFQFAAA